MTGRAIGGHESPRSITTTWLTPPSIVRALGEFDLDPCGHPGWPTARRAICLPDNGLTGAWYGRVWLNPPYGAGMWEWLERLANHGTGTALIFARTETAGFSRTVWGRADGLLFLRGRLRFHHSNGAQAKANAGAPSVLVAYGSSDARALARASKSGAIAGTYVTLAPSKAPR